MATDKEKMIKGLRFLAVAFPFIFMGPALYFGLGKPAMEQGNYLWAGVSVLLMVGAVYFGVRGLRTVLAAFFNDERKS